jgi:hypothetical protein
LILIGPHEVRKIPDSASDHGRSSFAGAVLGGGPQMRVRVERRRRGGMTQGTLHRDHISLAAWLTIPRGRHRVVGPLVIVRFHNIDQSFWLRLRFLKMRPIGLIFFLRAFSEQIGLGGQLTDSRGFLVGDPSRIVCDSWQEAAEGW